MSALLEIEGLEASYGAAQVLFGMTLSVGAGEVVTLMGRNGMGKTTTIRTLMGMMAASRRPYPLRWRGHDRQCPPYRIAQAGIGLVPEGRQNLSDALRGGESRRHLGQPSCRHARPGRWSASTGSSRA